MFTIGGFDNVARGDWHDWRWQKSNSIAIYPGDRSKENKLGILREMLGDDCINWEIMSDLAEVWAINITPHLAVQLHRLEVAGYTEWRRQILRFVLPTAERTNIIVPVTFVREGMGTEERRKTAYTNLPPNISRLYDNRVVVRVSTMCAVACQFCFRQHDVAEHHELEAQTRTGVENAVAYVRDWNRDNPSRRIRDVILTGGDPLSLGDDTLVRILSAFRAIEGVELLRIDTKYPAVLPQRITTTLAQALKKCQPVVFQIHFTHPGELCDEAKRACDTLAEHGYMLTSHTPLLQGVNDDREILKELFWKLLLMRVRPYYLIQSIVTPGTEHFRVPVEKALDLMKFLEADLDGPAHPHLILYTTGGGGKVHLQPQYLKKRTQEGWQVETWLGNDFYPDPR